MAIELGRYSVWASTRVVDVEWGPRLERLGFPALWLGAASGTLELARGLLDATEHLVVATGIVNIWRTAAADLAAAYWALPGAHRERFLLGIGTGHPESAGQDAAAPYRAISAYLDDLDAAGIPKDRLALAALGPRVLTLSADRTAGAHPYLVTPEHSRMARVELGSGPLLAPEQGVVFESDPEVARTIGREWIAGYLRLTNYRNNLRRIGFTDEDLATASDRLIDGTIAWGDDAAIRARLDEHLAAGADHVAVQILGPQPDYARLAAVLELAP